MSNIEKHQMTWSRQETSHQTPSYGIRARLFAGFSVIGIVLLTAIVIIIFRISAAEQFAKNVINIRVPILDFSYDFSNELNSVKLNLFGWIYGKNPAYKRQYFSASKNIKILKNKMDTLSEQWNNERKETWTQIRNLTDKFLDASSRAINADTPQVADDIIKSELTPIMNSMSDLMQGTVDANGKRVGGLYDNERADLVSGTDKIMNNLHSIKVIEYILLVIALITLPLAAYQTMRGILAYINVFRLHSNRVASGDLTQRIDVQMSDEMGKLGNDLNVMTANLSEITAQITTACHNMATSLEEVRHSVDIQSSGATEQASSINQITCSLEEIDKSSGQTIEKARALGEVAERTREKGQLGLEAVEKSVGGMKSVREKVQTIAETILELSNQTQQVGEITAVVNRLAQQSKMLALNASIEAAKAGEAGKGFAVVASEVKNLAEQSEQSTAQVQKILEDIRHATEKAVMATEEGTKGVDYGTVLVEQTGDIVRNLSNVIHETTIATQQIEAAIRQENVGIEQITAGMNEINQVTSSFVDSVRQTTEAMDSLGQMVANLKKNIDVYKV